jgi:type I restriction enzyme S subunit
MFLSEVAIYRKGKPAKKADSGNTLPILTPEYLRGKGVTETGLVTDNSILVEDNDVVLLWDGSNAGEFFKAKKGILASTMVKFLFSKHRIDESFFFYQLKYHEDFLKQQTNGSGIPHVDKEFLKRIKFTKTDKTEQTRIAQILSKADEAIAHTEALIAKYQRIKTGLMQDLLTRGIDANGNIRSEETHQFKNSPLGRIPVEWEVVSVGNLCEMTLGKMLNKEAKKGIELYDYLGNRSVQWGKFDFSDIEQMSFTYDEREKFRLVAGDVLMCEGGEVGRCAIWREERADCYFQKAIHRLRFDQQKMKSEFFVSYFQMLIAQGVLKDYVSQTSIAHLTQEKLATLPFVCPDSTEQKRITTILGKIENDSKVESTVLRKLHSIKKGLMQDLLSGPREGVKLSNVTDQGFLINEDKA